MFWGLIMEPQRRYTQQVKRSFHISMAALDVSTSSDEPAQVMCGFEGRNYLLCTLKKPDLLQCPLDLTFGVGSEVSFAANGKCHVHLTGYLSETPEFLDPEEAENEEEEEEEEQVEEEEVNNIAVKSKKRSKKILENGPPKKKLKSAKVSSSQNEDQDSDSDESDFDTDVKTLLEKSFDDSDDDSDAVIDEDVEEEEDEDDEESDEEEDSSLSEGESEDNEDEKTPKSKMNGVPKKQESKSKQESPKQKKDKKKNQIDQNKKSPKSEQKEVKTTPNKENHGKILQGGVVIEDIREGQGVPAKAGKIVSVSYEGRLKKNNKLFDSTNKGAAFSFRLGAGDVIKGWDVGVLGMKPGGKRRIICPPNMAYGQKGSPPAIPPNSTLIFEVELKKTH